MAPMVSIPNLIHPVGAYTLYGLVWKTYGDKAFAIAYALRSRFQAQGSKDGGQGAIARNTLDILHLSQYEALD
jgi:hypothetical protein